MDAKEQCRLPDDLSYEEWVRFVFDHPVLSPQWWWQEPESGYLQEWDDAAHPPRTLAYLTRLFQNPVELIDRLTRRQIDQGLNFLVSSSCSSHMSVLTNPKLPWAARRACFDAMIPLYAKLMSAVYEDDLGHTEYGPGDPERPTFACYMWWDVIALHGGMDHPDRDRINDAVLHVFEQVLKLKSEACLESVLHGLGHWYDELPDHTESIIRQFMTRTDISETLRSYAEDAAEGRGI